MMFAPPAEIVFGPVPVPEATATIKGCTVVVSDSTNCTLTITLERTPALNPRRAVELALLSGTLRRM